jgi:carboxyl-terminal processing protease
MRAACLIRFRFLALAWLAAAALGTGCATRRGPVGTASAPSPLHNGVETFDAVWKLVNDSHFDTKFGGVDWPVVRDELRPHAEAATNAAALRRVIQEMLDRLGDSHMALIPGEVADAFDPKTIEAKSEKSPKPQLKRSPNAKAASLKPNDPRQPEEATDDSDADLPASRDGDLGLEVRLLDKRFIVTSVEPGGPAAAAGVKPGWILRAVESNRLADAVLELSEDVHLHHLQLMAWSMARQHLRGRPGSMAAVEFLNDKDQPVKLELKRQRQAGEPVKFGNLPTLHADLQHERVKSAGGASVGLIRFNLFMVPVALAFNRAIDELRDADAMVLDLRGNVGGIAGMVMGMSGHFLNEPVSLGTLKMRGPELKFLANPRRVTTAGQLVEPFAGPVAILVDDISVSAAEVFAGGMQSVGRARVFGRPSAGEVLAAMFDRLPNGDVLLHAIADFTTATGARLEGRGVQPDEAVPLTREDLLAGRDAAMQAALKWIDRQRGKSARAN